MRKSAEMLPWMTEKHCEGNKEGATLKRNTCRKQDEKATKGQYESS